MYCEHTLGCAAPAVPSRLLLLRAMPPSTIFALKRAYQASRNALEGQLQGKGLTAAQLDVLKLLLGVGEKNAPPAPGLDQRALQEALGITSATLTRLLAGMERRGLVTRSVHLTDARSKKVKITPKAHQLFLSLMAQGEAEFNARLLSGFTEKEAMTLTRWLERIADNMSSPGG